MKSRATPLYAWAWPPDRHQINAWRDRLPGLRLVHYPATYHLAHVGDAAYVANLKAAEAALPYAQRWSFAILGDERNVPVDDDTAPSGPGETPEDYSARLKPADDLLRGNGITTSGAALAMAGGRFDLAYARAMTIGQMRGVNYRPYRYHRVTRGIETANSWRWFVTILPLRPNWWPLRNNTVLAWFRQACYRQSPERQIRELLTNGHTIGVGIWCLHEGRLSDGAWQGWHGLIDRHERLTEHGKAAQRILEET